MSTVNKTVFVQIRKEFQDYFTIEAGGYAVFRNTDPKFFNIMPNGAILIGDGNDSLYIASGVWVSASVMN